MIWWRPNWSSERSSIARPGTAATCLSGHRRRPVAVCLGPAGGDVRPVAGDLRSLRRRHGEEGPQAGQPCDGRSLWPEDHRQEAVGTLRQLISLFVKDGELVELAENHNGHWTLQRRSCPFANMADNRRVVCRIDQETISTVVGRHVRRWPAAATAIRAARSRSPASEPHIRRMLGWQLHCRRNAALWPAGDGSATAAPTTPTILERQEELHQVVDVAVWRGG